MTVAGDGTIIPGVCKWDGASYHAMDCGFNWDCTPPINTSGLANGGILSIAFWNGELYAGGDIYSINGEPAYNIARWDGSSWQNLGGGLNSQVWRLHGYADGLYAVGLFTHADGVEVNGLARWDGSAWHSVFDLPQFGSTINRVYDVAWYNGELYICGNFIGDDGVLRLARYDGSVWRSVGTGIQGSFSSVNLLEVHDGLLYVAGAFAQTQPYGPPENPGCGIVTWDGEQWGTLDEGTCGSANPTIYRMTWIQDTLYVTGRFDRIGGVPTGRVAKWDGHRWCSLVPPDYFYPDIGAIGSYRDTLIVGGSFTVAGPDNIDRIAKWVGGSYTSACGIATGIEPPEQTVSSISTFPNPAKDHLNVTMPNDLIGSMIALYDAAGRMVLTTRIDQASMMIDISALANGTYVLRSGDHERSRIEVLR